MKKKLAIYYLGSFILACSIIFLVNIIFMRSSIYEQGALYNYHPEKMISQFKEYIYLSNDNKVLINDEGLSKLEEDNIGIQILNKNNEEIFSYDKPDIAPTKYSNKSLIDMYGNEEETLFLDEKVLNGEVYTYLLFLDSEQVNRVTYSYDVNLLMKAHHFPILISINVVLILAMSFLFTSKITKPINRIIDKIENLSLGNYSRNHRKEGIYFEIDNCLNDLSDRLESNEHERKRLENMREEWISNITHDIKTPLTSIMGNAEIMGDIEYEIDDEVRVRYCNKIISKGEYIKTLVEDLNLSTRLKNNTLILNKKTINIVSLIRHLLIDIINDEKYNHNNISFKCSDEEIFIDADEQLIKRVFINLIINAFIHNDENVDISIKIEKLENKEVYISIEDNGKGILDTELEYIFERFYRGTNTRQKTEGSGLGMAIAYDIVKAHKGNITAKSKLNKGLKIDIIFS